MLIRGSEDATNDHNMDYRDHFIWRCCLSDSSQITMKNWLQKRRKRIEKENWNRGFCWVMKEYHLGNKDIFEIHRMLEFSDGWVNPWLEKTQESFNAGALTALASIRERKK